MKRWSEEFLSVLLNFSKRIKSAECPVFVDDGSIILIFKNQAKACEYYSIDSNSMSTNVNKLSFTADGKKFYRLLQ